MNKNVLLSTLLVIFMVIPFIGCSARMQRDQLSFGIHAAQKDLWDEAIFRWKKVLQNNPNSAAAHNNLAVAYERRGRLEEAEQEYQAALKISPNNEYIQSNYNKLKKNRERQNEESDKKNEILQ